jgi:hypothetical protein
MNNDISNPLIQNSIFWGNSAPTSPNILNNVGSASTLRYSLVEGGLPEGNIDGGNNLFVDPLFVRGVNCGSDGCGDDPNTPADESANDDYGDLRLQAASPAIDVGDNAADLDGSDSATTTIAALATDLDGNPRLSAVLATSATVDLGAYEASNAPPAFTSTPVTAATEETPYAYTVTASDPNQPSGSGLVLTAPVIPAWLTLVDNGDGTGSLSGAPGANDVGTAEVSLQVADAANATAVQSFQLQVSQTPIGGISGTVFADANDDGDQDAGELGVAGVMVTLSDEGVAAAGVTFEQETETNAQGNYSFTAVPAGEYTLSFSPPAGYALPDAPSVQVTVEAGQTTTAPGFGVTVVEQALHLPLMRR